MDRSQEKTGIGIKLNIKQWDSLFQYLYEETKTISYTLSLYFLLSYLRIRRLQVRAINKFRPTDRETRNSGDRPTEPEILSGA